jgi:hypothetical protein
MRGTTSRAMTGIYKSSEVWVLGPKRERMLKRVTSKQYSDLNQQAREHHWYYSCLSKTQYQLHEFFFSSSKFLRFHKSYQSWLLCVCCVLWQVHQTPTIVQTLVKFAGNVSFCAQLGFSSDSRVGCRLQMMRRCR